MSHRNRILRNFDIFAVLCLAVLPGVVISIFAVVENWDYAATFAYRQAMVIVRSLQISLPILLIMRLRGVYWPKFGFMAVRPLRDSVTSLVLALSCYMTSVLIRNLLMHSGISLQTITQDPQEIFWGSTPKSVFTIPVLILANFANGFAEEIALRSYLLTRLAQITRSKEISIVLTSLLYAGYHIYQGLLGTLAAFVNGFMFGMYFVTTRRIWPLVAAHALYDLIVELQYLWR